MLGAAIAAAIISLTVLPAQRENWRSQGLREGRVTAQWQIAEDLYKAFASKPISCGDGRLLFSVKTSSVYVFDCAAGRQVFVEH
jgi:hypothetical protein